MTESPQVRRQLPRWSDLRPLLTLRKPRWRAVDRRLGRALTIDDLALAARRRVPTAVFEYVSGAAENEISLARARAAYRRVELEPSVLQDVSRVDTSTLILGQPAAMPLILAPTGFTRMMHHEGESAVASAASAANLPYCLSTVGTTSPETVRQVAPAGRNWFQLYLWRDRHASKELLARVAAAGYDTVVLTVDTPVAGNRLRDERNGLTIPPALTLRTLADFARHPSWWLNVLTTPPLEFASLNSFDGTVAELIGSMFDPALTIDDLHWLRSEWSGNVVIKGVQSTADAMRVIDAGADALVLSNHGGRQLDRAPTPLELLAPVVELVAGRAEVYVDTGIGSGADILAAVGLGATACMVGRAYLYGLMAGGRPGVARALAILHDEATRTMQLMGATGIADLRGRVRLRPA